MRVAIFGDVMGRTGRTTLVDALPRLIRRFSIDFTVINVENAAGGFGVTRAIGDAFLDAGADVLTTGNHAFDQRDELDYFNDEPRILRPLNFPPSNPGRGAGLYTARTGAEVMVLHAQGQVAMHPCDDPFAAVDAALAGAELGREADAILLDFHAEATSEKQAMGYHLDGRASAVVGTHTHCPTADDRILPDGTAFMTDLGMCGDYDSIIGMQKNEPMTRFVTKMNQGRFSPAGGEATICGLLIETSATGRALRAAPLRLGGTLSPTHPDW